MVQTHADSVFATSISVSTYELWSVDLESLVVRLLKNTFQLFLMRVKLQNDTEQNVNLNYHVFNFTWDLTLVLEKSTHIQTYNITTNTSFLKNTFFHL